MRIGDLATGRTLRVASWGQVTLYSDCRDLSSDFYSVLSGSTCTMMCGGRLRSIATNFLSGHISLGTRMSPFNEYFPLVTGTNEG